MWLVLAMIGCAERQVYDTPIPMDDTFVRAEPSPEALERYEAAAAYSEAHGGRALMVLEGDAVVFETGQNGLDLEDPNEIFSGTKSFSCAMFLAAREDGLVDLADPVVDVIPEWQGDATKERIVVSDLLHFTSGLEDDFWRLTYDGLLVDQRVEDKYAFAVAQPTTFEPGSDFRYNGTDLLVWGEVAARITGEDPVAYLERRVLDRIGFRYSGWNRDPSGNPMLAYGAWTTVNEWAKYGVLVRDDGVWKGETVLPTGAFADCLVGSAAMPAYGLNFWVNADLSEAQASQIPADLADGRPMPSAPDDAFMAAGANDNRLYVVPSRDLVVVRLGDGHFRWSDDAFLAEVLGP